MARPACCKRGEFIAKSQVYHRVCNTLAIFRAPKKHGQEGFRGWPLCRTYYRDVNVGELIQRLQKLDLELPVVMAQEDEPVGCYEVLDVDERTMHPDKTFTRDPTAWHDSCYTPELPPQQVAFLGRDRPYLPVIDVEVELPNSMEPDAGRKRLCR